MSVKFKVGFTMSAETLFGIIAKFLPVEDLEVEEIEPRVVPVAKVEKIARLVGPKNRHEPATPPRAKRRRPAIPISLDKGVNGIILRAFEDGKPHAAGELRPLVLAAGYSEGSIASRLAKLRDYGAVHQPEYGLWQIGEAPPAKKSATG
jgi:hypothetical protein